jgi:NADH-quinone oxidoreductase subunit H
MLLAVYVERKLAAFIQDRLGPTEVGYKGTLQSVADLIKLLQKEVIIPQAAHQKLFLLAPAWILITVMLGFAVLPVNNAWLGAPTHTGLLFLLGILSLKVIGILLAGWSSNNKFARLGALRAVTQYLAYEIPIGLSVLCVILVTRTLDLAHISAQQGLAAYHIDGTQVPSSYLLGIKGWEVTSYGGFLTWNICRMPCLAIAYVIFLVSSLAVSNRAPFDLAEAESELVAGYQVEYGGIYWAWMMLAEYAVLFLMSMLGVIFFWGGWNTPFPNIGSLQLALYTNGHPSTWLGSLWASFWLLGKTCLIILVQIWIKWTFPRLRADQLLKLCWVYLIPLGLLTLLLTLWWQFLIL